jgi:hypothetical protein
VTRSLHNDQTIHANVLKLRINRPKNQEHSYPTTTNTIQVLWIKNHTFFLLLHLQTYIVGVFFLIVYSTICGSGVFGESQDFSHLKKLTWLSCVSLGADLLL